MHLIAYERRKQEWVQSYKLINILFHSLKSLSYRMVRLDRMKTLNYIKKKKIGQRKINPKWISRLTDCIHLRQELKTYTYILMHWL